jgi:hemerythrin-like metal-binding protein
MDRIAWDDTLVTGDDRIDADHRELAGLFNLLRDAAEGGKDKTACAAVFDTLIQHAQAHFELEQRLMAQHRYPEAEQHAAEHAMLMRQAQDYRARFDLDRAAARADLLQFSEVWLAFHILFSDKALAAFLAEKRGATHPRL